MTKDEAIIVANIMMTADGGCSVCAGRLLTDFVDCFPDFKEQIDEIWKKEYGEESNYGEY